MPYKSKKEEYEYEKRRYRRARKRLILLLGGKCFLCGYSGEFLHIHHPDDRSGRNRTIGQLNREFNEGKRLILLCVLCHRAVTRLLHWLRIGVVDKAIEISGFQKV
jgi:hypothetical protein